jgi:hypothetical protein
MKNKDKKPTIMRMVECAWCSRPFRKSLYEINRTGINFCSYSCFRKNSCVQHKTTRNKIVLWDNFAEVHIVRKNGNIIKALIDLDDVEKVAQCRWYLLGKYVKSVKVGYLAHFVLGTQVDKTEEMHLDHINRNKLDNRKTNLRIVPRIENIRNNAKRASESAGRNVAIGKPELHDTTKPEAPENTCECGHNRDWHDTKEKWCYHQSGNGPCECKEFKETKPENAVVLRDNHPPNSFGVCGAKRKGGRR